MREEEPRMEIDQLQLDKEWRRHPQEYYNWARRAADAGAVYDESKVAVEVAWAEMDAEIRADPEDYGLAKVTESGIEAVIKTSSMYMNARAKMLKAKHEKDIAEAVVSALEHRRRSLDALTSLFLRDYYSDSGPRPQAGEGREDWEKRATRRRGLDRVKEEVETEDGE